MSVLPVVALLGGVFLGLDIFVAVALAALIGLYSIGGVDMLPLLSEKLIQGLDSFPLLAIPLFIVAGHIMAKGGIARRLVEVLLLAIGRVPGSMAQVTLLSTFALSGVSGSASADTAAIGSITIPEMKRRNYPAPFAAAVTATAGATGHLMPPSIDLIIVGVVANVSVSALFLAGIIPALVNLVAMLALTMVIAIVRKFPADDTDRSRWVHTLVSSLPALGMPVIILGGIRMGLFTPTEAAAVAVLYSSIVGLFVYRELRLEDVPTLLVDACKRTGAVLFVIAAASALSFYLTFEQVPDAIAMFITSHADNVVAFLLWVNLVFLLVGMVMDALPALIVLMPILVPIAQSYGLDPIHFCIIVLANVGLSFITPPVGLCLYLASAIAKADVGKVMVAILPFTLVLLLMVGLIAAVPQLSLWLPSLAAG
jgi:tripartite ATP-independent transporter DctM subunit